MNDFCLFDYQKQMAARHLALLSRRNVTADRSDTGLGKTLAILAAISESENKFVVICPKSVRTHWRRWISAFDLDRLCCGVFGWEEMKLGLHPEIFDRHHWPNCSSGRLIIIFDEAHRAKNYKTQNAKMVKRAREQGHQLALLSATLIQSPLDLGGLAYPLGLVSHPRFWFQFARRFGAGLNAWKGYADFSHLAQRQELHTLLDKVSVRVRKDQVAPGLCINQADLVDADNCYDIGRVYLEMQTQIAELRRKAASAAEILTARLRARQAAELLKVNLFVELALEHLNAGAKVALFFCFNQSVEWAIHAFNEMQIAIAHITGAVSGVWRDAAIEAFNGEGLDVLVLNIAAGGEGISIHDATGNKPRVCLLSPPESAVVLVQALGRPDRVGSKSVALNRVIFIANTVEEKVYDNVRRKIRNLSVLNDGDLNFDPFSKNQKEAA